MEDSFDKFGDDLQESIITEAGAHYSDKVVDLWLSPTNKVVLGLSYAHGGTNGTCGDTSGIFLQGATLPGQGAE